MNRPNAFQDSEYRTLWVFVALFVLGSAYATLTGQEGLAILMLVLTVMMLTPKAMEWV